MSGSEQRIESSGGLVLSVRGAEKSFGYVRALRGVDLEVREREIVALVGDNGAGKSTLIKAISGVSALDAGEIRVAGERVSFKSPADARRHGIETVYQDLAMFDNLDVASNFFMGRESMRLSALGMLGWLNRREMARRWQDYAARLRIAIPDARQPVGLMSGGQRQAIAVARAFAFAQRFVILDEPTAALGIRESHQVLQLISQLPKQGVAVLLISHNLDHIAQVADRVVVMRQGVKVGEAEASPSQHEYIVGLMMGAGSSPSSSVSHT